MLEVGNQAPDFTSVDQDNNKVSLSDCKGQKVALYFYPKDDTPGCTKQACSIRDYFADLEKANIKILGVSPDGIESHQKFIKKYDLPFTVLADPDKEICLQYNIWREKNMYGNIKMGIVRTTFLIDEEGKIVHIIKRPKTAIHAEEILAKFEKVAS